MSVYGQFCPVSQALEVVGERWTLLVIRELLCGNYRFNELLNGVPLMSRSLLAQRLKSLESNGLVMKRLREDGATYEYCLTAAGKDLEPIVTGLGMWGQRWVGRKYNDEELDPVLLMWDVRRNLAIERVPERQTVVMFWFRDVSGKRSRYWLRVERPEAELCLTNPGLDVDLTVETTVRTMAEVWMGRRKLNEALASGEIRIEGQTTLKRAFPRWLMLNPFTRIASTGATG